MYTLPPKARFSSSVGNGLFNSASLDLHFAKTKSLVDATTGSNLMTFTRASSGTYVGSDGLIKTATTNLLLRSEEFDDAGAWSLLNIAPFGSGSIANAIMAPNGVMTADKIVENTATSAHTVNQIFSCVSGVTYTYSIYVKAGERTDFQINSATGFGLNAVRYDLTSGQAFVLAGSPVFFMTPVGNGWYRCGLTVTATSSSVGGTFVNYIRNSTTSSYTGDGTSGIYLWGAQLEQSSTVGEYVKTTSTINSAPRFDHDPTTGESLGLLVEESRTNLITFSEEINNAAWTILSNASLTANALTSPSDTLTADLLVENTATSEHGIQSPSVNYTSGTTYTYSIFAKTLGGRGLRILLPEAAFGQNKVVWFNLAAGTITSTQGTGVTATVTPYPSDWYRLSVSSTATATASGTSGQLRLISTGTTTTYTGNGTSGIYLWGAQLEGGSFPTSYIPTTSSTVTRAADVASISGSNYSSFANATENTVFVEAAVPEGITSSRAMLSLDDGSNSNRIQIRHNGTTARSYIVADNSNVQFSAQLVGNSFLPGQYVKLAMAAKANDFAAVRTFGELDTDTSGTMPTVNQLQIGLAPGNAQPCKPIKRITYWPVRLPDATLLTITS